MFVKPDFPSVAMVRTGVKQFVVCKILTIIYSISKSQSFKYFSTFEGLAIINSTPFHMIWFDANTCKQSCLQNAFSFKGWQIAWGSIKGFQRSMSLWSLLTIALKLVNIFVLENDVLPSHALINYYHDVMRPLSKY